MRRRGCPAEFRRKVLDLVESGCPVADVVKALGISDQAIYTWRRQDRIDKGLELRPTSGEKSELAAAGRAEGDGAEGHGWCGSRSGGIACCPAVT